jgi:hypothetical protein
MQALTDKISKLMESFAVEAAKAVNGNKAAGARARKVSLELTKALKEFRAVSVGA